jgi:hypothetical protein
MIRTLVMIAVAGFVLALATLSAAVAIGGPDAIARGGWHWTSNGWGHDKDFDWDPDFDLEDGPPTGPQATRTLAWTGGDSLRTRFPAEIRYVQAAAGSGPGTVTVTGPQDTVQRVYLDEGAIRLRRQHWANRRLTVVVTAPNISRFVLSGANRLTVEDYKGERLELKLSGATKVKASGQVRELELDISGAGEADLGELKVEDVDIDISGSGEARVAPTGRAKVDISGMGDVTLLTRPADLESDISGAGAIHQEETPAPAAPEAKARAKTRT